jgi:DNA polymerase III subunit delta'
MPLTEIAGNRPLISSLEAELTRRPSHAYLFAGPRGIGKATIARGLAQSILCERSPGPAFCCNPVKCPTRTAAQATSGRSRNTAPPALRCACCNGCVQVALGVHPDFNSVARQANRSEVLIEQVRDLIGRLGSRPSRGPRRVAIIDDAETLNLPAQNALLKTLEEPPGATIIFMITQSERALLDTIRSRMRPVRFGPLTPADVASVLIARKLDPARANAVALLARGSVAHALALAEGDEPPVKELLKALGEAASLDFASIQPLVQNCFGVRDQAVGNFELIARLFEEMLCYRLLKTDLAASASDAQTMIAMANRFAPKTMAELAEAALAAASAVEAMANSRLQAEQFFMTAGRALRG